MALLCAVAISVAACSRTTSNAPSSSDTVPSQAADACPQIAEFRTFLERFQDGVPGRVLRVEVHLPSEVQTAEWRVGWTFRSLKNWDRWDIRNGEKLKRDANYDANVTSILVITGYDTIVTSCARGEMSLTKDGDAWFTTPIQRTSIVSASITRYRDLADTGDPANGLLPLHPKASTTTTAAA